MVSATIAAVLDVGKVWCDIQWFMLSTMKFRIIYIYIYTFSDEAILLMCLHLNGQIDIQTILVPKLWSTTDVGDVLSFGLCNHCCIRGCGKSLVWYTMLHAFHHEVLNYVFFHNQMDLYYRCVHIWMVRPISKQYWYPNYDPQQM